MHCRVSCLKTGQLVRSLWSTEPCELDKSVLVLNPLQVIGYHGLHDFNNEYTQVSADACSKTLFCIYVVLPMKTIDANEQAFPMNTHTSINSCMVQKISNLVIM